jgi:hypothetical protein
MDSLILFLIIPDKALFTKKLLNILIYTISDCKRKFFRIKQASSCLLVSKSNHITIKKFVCVNSKWGMESTHEKSGVGEGT